MTNLIKTNNFSKFLKGTKLDKEKYKKLYNESIENNEEFWDKVAKRIDWIKPYSNVKEVNFNDNVSIKWYLKGELNVCSNCLDRHLQTRGDKVAILWEGDDPKKSKKITYKELYKEVCKFSNVLKNQGVKKGDCVTIYLPMIPEAAIAMLACSRIGAVHSVVFGGFSPDSLADRINDCDSAIIITADEGTRGGKIIPLKDNADKAAEKAPCLKQMIVVKRTGNKINWNEARDFWYEKLMNNVSDISPPEKMNSEDPLFILYTSGTTGMPKGIVHDTGGYATQAYLTTKWNFNLRDNDIMWCTADIGWITGHTYAFYGPLLNGGTTLIYEGAPDFPNFSRWWKIINQNKVNVFYTAPTAIRMFMKAGDKYLKNHIFSSLKILGTVGEPIDKNAWMWYFRKIGKNRCPIIDTWWQTETGGTLINALPGIGPFIPTVAGKSFPGTRHIIVNEKGKQVKSGKTGSLVQLSPFAPGMLHGIYRNHKKYIDTYWKRFKNKYDTSDGAYVKSNLIRLTGRTDDVMKVAGHRLATAELENAINEHKLVNESAIIPIPDKIKGQVPIAFVILKSNKPSLALEKQIIKHVDKKIGPTARLAKIYFVEDLPKTRSGKIMRRILKSILVNEKPKGLQTLINPQSVNKIKTRIFKKI